MHFREWKILYFHSNFSVVCFSGFNWQLVSIGSGNCLAPNRRPVITWINADLVHWHVCGTRERWVSRHSHFPFYINTWDGTGCWNTPSGNTKTLLSCIINALIVAGARVVSAHSSPVWVVVCQKLLPGWLQAINWISADFLSIWLLETCGIEIENNFHFRKLI